MQGRSQLLDLGRRTRTVPERLRRALVLRDEHCQFPGCRAPASWCDAHHLVWWTRGGETSLWNLVLLCRRHHVAVHEGGWKLERGPDGLTLVA
jgi:5-methylcytosine-specific restriction endonuclease McrA